MSVVGCVLAGLILIASFFLEDIVLPDSQSRPEVEGEGEGEGEVPAAAAKKEKGAGPGVQTDKA